MTRGAGVAGRVPARRQLGFVQYIPSGQTAATPLATTDVTELLDTYGPLGGPIDCSITIGASQQEMRITGVYASNAGVNPGNGLPEYAVRGLRQPRPSGRRSVERGEGREHLELRDPGRSGPRYPADPAGCAGAALGRSIATVLAQPRLRLRFPDVVSLEATVKYGYWMQVVPGQVAPGIDVGMEGLAKLLDGLLGFTLGVEGRALITRFSLDPDHFCHLLGSILISGSVQVSRAVRGSAAYSSSTTARPRSPMGRVFAQDGEG